MIGITPIIFFINKRKIIKTTHIGWLEICISICYDYLNKKMMIYMGGII